MNIYVCMYSPEYRSIPGFLINDSFWKYRDFSTECFYLLFTKIRIFFMTFNFFYDMLDIAFSEKSLIRRKPSPRHHRRRWVGLFGKYSTFFLGFKALDYWKHSCSILQNTVGTYESHNLKTNHIIYLCPWRLLFRLPRITLSLNQFDW